MFKKIKVEKIKRKQCINRIASTFFAEVVSPGGGDTKTRAQTIHRTGMKLNKLDRKLLTTQTERRIIYTSKYNRKGMRLKACLQPAKKTNFEDRCLCVGVPHQIMGDNDVFPCTRHLLFHATRALPVRESLTCTNRNFWNGGVDSIYLHARRITQRPRR